MPTFGATIAIINGNNILLTLRQDFPVWCLPGGGVEPGETLAETALREAFEETGLMVRLTRLVGIYSRPITFQGGGHEVLFSAEPISGETRSDGKETMKVQWFPFDNLPDRLVSMHRKGIQDAIVTRPAVVRRMNAYPTLSKISRQELYKMRDQGKLDLQACLIELCTPLSEQDSYDELEVENLSDKEGSKG